MSLGPAEILVILVVGLLVLGPQKLPEAGRQVARGLAEVKRLRTAVRDEIVGSFMSDEHDGGTFS